MQHGFKFLEARVVVVASPDKSITANLKDSVKDCASQMRKDSTEEQIPQSDKELFHSFQGFFDSAFGATQFASWVVGNICLIRLTGYSIYSPLPLCPSVVQIHMIVPMKDPIL
eukprot:85945-Rhodomonas_salina.1